MYVHFLHDHSLQTTQFKESLLRCSVRKAACALAYLPPLGVTCSTAPITDAVIQMSVVRQRIVLLRCVLLAVCGQTRLILAKAGSS